MCRYFSLVALIPALPAPAAAQQAQSLAFEVASVRRAPDYASLTPEEIRAGRRPPLPRMNIEGDRVDITNTSMRLILATAYGRPGIYVFGESWLDSARWDIQAKMPAGVARQQVLGMQALQTSLATAWRLDPTIPKPLTGCPRYWRRWG